MEPFKAARLLFQLPRDCRLFRAINPALEWGWREGLANKTNHLLEILIWQNTKDARKKNPSKMPKIFKPPFGKDKEPKEVEAHTVDDIKNILARPRVVPGDTI